MEDLPSTCSGFKSYTARGIIDLLEANEAKTLLQHMQQLSGKAHRNDRKHQFWQEGSHPQIIENEVILKQKLDYIHNNPVKREYVDRPEQWRGSNA